MRRLKIVILTDDAERLRGALAMAAAQAALGMDAEIFFQMDAVALLCPGATAPQDAAHQAAGLPSLAQLIDDALAVGVRLIVCQSGLALVGIGSAALDSAIVTSGSVSFMQSVADDDRLLFV